MNISSFRIKYSWNIETKGIKYIYNPFRILFGFLWEMPFVLANWQLGACHGLGLSTWFVVEVFRLLSSLLLLLSLLLTLLSSNSRTAKAKQIGESCWPSSPALFCVIFAFLFATPTTSDGKKVLFKPFFRSCYKNGRWTCPKDFNLTPTLERRSWWSYGSSPFVHL